MAEGFSIVTMHTAGGSVFDHIVRDPVMTEGSEARVEKAKAWLRERGVDVPERRILNVPNNLGLRFSIAFHFSRSSQFLFASIEAVGNLDTGAEHYEKLASAFLSDHGFVPDAGKRHFTWSGKKPRVRSTQA